MNLKVPGAILPLGCVILSTRAITVRGVGTTPLRRTRVKLIVIVGSKFSSMAGDKPPVEVDKCDSAKKKNNTEDKNSLAEKNLKGEKPKDKAPKSNPKGKDTSVHSNTSKKSKVSAGKGKDNLETTPKDVDHGSNSSQTQEGRPNTSQGESGILSRCMQALRSENEKMMK